MAPATSVTIISSPYHLGSRDVAVGAGPTALLEAGIADAIRSQGGGGVAVHVRELEPVADEFDGEIAQLFALLRRTSRAVAEAVRAGSFPLVLSGNCSATVGVQAGLVVAASATEISAAPSCVWFDAHDDFNTPDVLASGYLDSMPVAMLGGLCWQTLLGSIPGFRPADLERQFVHCGMRDVTDLERGRVLEAGFPVVWGGDVDKHVDFEAGLRAALEARQLGDTMVHLDLDVLDPSVGPVNKFSAPGGLSESDLAGCMRMLSSKTRPVSLTVASDDPSFDEGRAIPPVAVKAVVAFVQSMVSTGVLQGTSS